jgi:hypothetical protein
MGYAMDNVHAHDRVLFWIGQQQQYTVPHFLLYSFCDHSFFINQVLLQALDKAVAILKVTKRLTWLQVFLYLATAKNFLKHQCHKRVGTKSF